MDISIGSDSLYTPAVTSNNTNANKLESKLKNVNPSDESLMDACKNFESYFVEQVFKEMEKTVNQEEEKGPYLQQFGDMQYEEYAKDESENGGLGIAQMLYDSMKRNA